jgi:cytoskeletal protein CcmA (bactofilin family)
MFKKKESFNLDGFDSIIGANASFEGNFSSSGVIKIDGNVTGDVNVEGDVFIGCAALVKGNITAVNVNLGGSVEGNIQARGILHILSTAKLMGDIEVHSLVADEGAVFKGTCSMFDNKDKQSTPIPNQEKIVKKTSSSKDYKKSSVLSQIYDEKQNSEQAI